MNNLSALIWVEARKALRSRIPFFTFLAAAVMPLGIAFLLYLARNPRLAQNLGLVAAKADLTRFYATDWPAYMEFTGQIVSAAGFFLGVFAISWVFGREFADGTLKDLLAVPVSRIAILMAKFSVVAAWSALIYLVILALSLAVGGLLHLPGGSARVLLDGCAVALVAGCLVICNVFPFALFASVGRGYLLPLGLAVFTMVLVNLSMVIGLGEYFPWAVPLLFSSGKAPLGAVSLWIVILTGAAGLGATALWWMRADQDR